jgi:hypothetical protein
MYQMQLVTSLLLTGSIAIALDGQSILADFGPPDVLLGLISFRQVHSVWYAYLECA